MSKDSSAAATPLLCRLVSLSLVALNLSRTLEVPPEIEPFDELLPSISMLTNVDPPEHDDDIYVAQVRLMVELKSPTGESLLHVDVEYESLCEVTSTNEPQALAYLDQHAAELVCPHASQLIADLVSRAGLPPFFLQPRDLQHRVPDPSASAESHQPTLQ